jgi:WD40 repeat protein
MTGIARRGLLKGLCVGATGALVSGCSWLTPLAQASGGQAEEDPSHQTSALASAGVSRLDGYRRIVDAVRFNGDGSRIVLAGGDTDLQVWDALTGRQLLAKKLPAPACCVAFSRKGALVASGGWARYGYLLGGTPSAHGRFAGSRILQTSDGLIRIWEVESGRLVRELQFPGAPPKAIAFSQDDSRMMAIAEDHVLRAWDIPTGQPAFSVEGPRTGPWAARNVVTRPFSFGAAGEGAAAVYSDKIEENRSEEWRHFALLWDLRKRPPRVLRRAEEAGQDAVAVSADGALAATSSSDPRATEILVRSIDSGRVVRMFHVASEQPLTFLAFDPAGMALLAGCQSGRLLVLDGEQGTILRAIQGPPGAIRDVASLDDEYRVVAAGNTSSDRRDEAGYLIANPLLLWDSKGR